MRNVIDRKLVYGITFILVIAMIVVLTIAMYRNAFKSTKPLTVVTDRAGLTLGPGSPVKLHGVQVGTVKDARVKGSHVDVSLDIDSGQLHNIPAGVTAQIVPPTAFGAKYVQLTAPAAGSAHAISAGSVIRANRVTTEVNTAFENLTHVLDAARPNEVNNALTALATAVDGRGERIGRLITQVDGYLTSFNPSLQTLSQDLHSGKSVIDTYDRALPALLSTAGSLTTTSNTVVHEQASLHAFMINLNSFSSDASGLIRNSRKQLHSSLTLLEPVTSTLARFSPEVPCLVLGLASANKLAEKAVGGTNPGVTTITKIVPARKAYTYPKNLPRLGNKKGPACYGLPYVTAKEAKQHAPDFDMGANPYAGPVPTAGQNLSTTLFGVLAGLVNAR